MKNLKINRDPKVALKFETYPQKIQSKLFYLRQLIIEVATEIEAIEEIEESLKWGEPSYLVKKGSPIRIDWKARTPCQYAMYFKCTSKLIETIKTVYKECFRYENNRALLFNLQDKIPEKELKSCIGLALNYHSIKHLHRLGL